MNYIPFFSIVSKWPYPPQNGRISQRMLFGSRQPAFNPAYLHSQNPSINLNLAIFLVKFLRIIFKENRSYFLKELKLKFI